MNQLERSVSGLSVTMMTKNSIADSIKSMEQALAAGGASPEILLRGWATFEALARYLMPEEFSKPQTPGRLVEKLAFEGYVTPSEADLLRRLAAIRNSFIHGDLNQSVSNTELETFIGILRIMSGFESVSPARVVGAA